MPKPLSLLYNRVYAGTNYRLRTLAGGRWASRCRPTSIMFLLTELCNARCVHCDIWKNRGREDAPSEEEWRTVVTDVRRWLGPVQVVFSGGEALLRPFTTDLVAHGASLGLLPEILTHGYWDDQSKIEKLALANPWRMTVSLDAVSETHTKIRGRDRFFQKTSATIATLLRMRQQHRLDYEIRLKTVIMSHNLDEVDEVARFATRSGMRAFYQPIEQNYNTPEDPRWFETSENWPKDTERVVATVQRLIQMKRDGFQIDNSYAQLEAMIPYFRDPDAWRVSTQGHSAHERRALCAALTMLQFQANGDVTVCYGMKPVGNVKAAPVRRIWENRPRFWEEGCCLDKRCTTAEKQALSLPIVS